MNSEIKRPFKSVTLSYDDGVTQDIRLIELLNKYGLKCTFNLNSALLGQKGMLPREGLRIAHYKIHPDDVKYVYEGHEIASHTLTHPNLSELGKLEVIRQVEEDRLRLSELAGYEVVGMAYPGGFCDDRVSEIIRDCTGIKYSRTVNCVDSLEPQKNLLCFNPNVYHLDFDRLMDFGRRFVELKADRPQNLYVWGHAYEMDYKPDYWIRLEAFFELISGHDDIFYGTNREVLL